jgi:hypothetical protein
MLFLEEADGEEVLVSFNFQRALHRAASQACHPLAGPCLAPA